MENYYNYKHNGKSLNAYISNFSVISCYPGVKIKKIKDVRTAIIVGASYEVYLNDEFMGYSED